MFKTNEFMKGEREMRTAMMMRTVASLLTGCQNLDPASPEVLV